LDANAIAIAIAIYSTTNAIASTMDNGLLGLGISSSYSTPSVLLLDTALDGVCTTATTYPSRVPFFPTPVLHYFALLSIYNH